MDVLQQRDKNLLLLLQAINPNLPTLVLLKFKPILDRGYQLWMLENLIINTMPFMLEEIENMATTSTHQAD